MGSINDLILAGKLFGSGGGGGGFSTATLIVNISNPLNGYVPLIREEPIPYIDTHFNESGTYTVVLYEGNCALMFEDEMQVTYEGSVEVLAEGFAYNITGDAEITILS